MTKAAACMLAGWMGLTPPAPGDPAPVNLGPVLGGLAGDISPHSEGGPSTLLDASSDATLTDADSVDFAGGKVTVSITTNRVDAEDRLEIRHEGTGPGQIGITGADVTFGGTTIGTFAGGSSSNALVVTLLAPSSPAAVQALIRSLSYTNSNGNDPSPLPRQVMISVDDGDGGTANAALSVAVTAVNDAPTLVGPTNWVTFAGQNLALTGITAADVDAGNAVITATLSAVTGAFTASSGGGVTIAGSGTTLLELTATLSNLNAFIAAANVHFVTPANAAADVVLGVAVNDGGYTGTDPGLSGDAFTEAALESYPMLVLPVVRSVAVPTNGSYAAGQDLDFTVTLSEPVSVDTNGGWPRLLLDIGGTNASAFYLLGSGTNALVFRYTVQPADLDGDGITVGANLDLNGGRIQDSSSNAVATLLNNVASTAGVLVNSGNPVAINDTFNVAEDTVLAGNVLANDFDGNGDPLTASLVANPTNGMVVLGTNGTFVYTPATNVHGSDSFTYKVNDGVTDSPVALVTITITPVNDAPRVVSPIPDQTASYGTNFTFTFNPAVFTDLDVDALTYTAAGLPAGITFTATNLTFAGIPSSTGSNLVRVVANDGQLTATNTFSLFVGRAILLAVADNKTRTYGAANPALTITYTGFLGADTAASLTNPPVISTTASNTSPVGSYAITLTNGADHRYSLVLSNGVFTISKATLVATPVSKSKAFGEPNPPLAIVYLGFVHRETEAVLDVPPTASTTAVQNSPPGTYPITLTGGSDNNYNLVLRDGTLVVRETGVPPASGNYYGLFYETSGVQTNSSGAFDLKTTAGTSFSALLRIEGRKYRFTGTFDALGRFTNELIRVGFFPVMCELEIGSTNSPYELSGRILLSGGGWESPLLARRASYHATTNPAPQAARYSLFLPGANNAIVNEPYGHSHATVNVSANGKVNFQAQLGDTTTASAAMVLTENGSWPCYVPIRGRDALLGWLTFTNLPAQDISGRLTWTVWPAPKRVLYPDGFRATRDIYGSRYTPPTGTNLIINLPAGEFVSTVGDVFLPTMITNVVRLGTNHRFTATNGAAIPISLRRQSGMFSGYIRDPLLGAIYRFSGTMLQKTNVGVGFHSGSLTSGRVEYLPAPSP